MLDDIAEIILSPLMSDAKKRECIEIAYKLGLSDGRVEGAKDMGDHMVGTLDAHLSKVTP